MHRAVTERVLDEHDVLVRTRQYDIALVYAAPLRDLALTSLGTALLRCENLTALDLTRNALTSLDGLAVDGHSLPQLTFLNAAENQIADIRALTACGRLQRVWLEGNRLDSRSSLEPLAKLPDLQELRLIRTIELDGAPLVLDNPFCANTEAYAATVAAMFSRVRWVDDKMFRGVDSALSESANSAAPFGGKKLEPLQVAAETLAKVTEEAQTKTHTEIRFEKLLAS